MRRTPPRAVVVGMLLVVVAMLLLALSIRARAQAPTDAPKLTDVAKLQILNAAKDVEIATLKLDAARLAMQTLLAAVTPAGYQINDRLELVPVPAPPKDPKDPKEK